MSLSQMLLPEFDHEMATTRKVLSRIPEGRFDFKPHPTSMTLIRLSTHIAEMVGWVDGTLKHDSYDMAPVGGAPYKSPEFTTRQEILDFFDKNVASAHAAIEATDDAAFGKQWSLLRGGEPLFSQPRIAAYRSMLLNHVIHHRGQLSVYLRMTEQPVPSIYGPSADEQ